MQFDTLGNVIVVADDDPSILQLFEYRLKSWGYPTYGAASKPELMDLLTKQLPCLLILDLHFGSVNALECLGELLQRFPDLLVVILSGDGTIENAVAAVKCGAYDFLTKPVDWLRLEMILRHAAERQQQRQRIQLLEESVVPADLEHALLGDSTKLRRVRALIDAIAPTDAPVLILGETGTGKELVARQLHQKSGQADGPFIAVNMTALPSSLAESILFGHEKGAFTGADRTYVGCFERAAGGTLLLDEIGDLDQALQGKLLRVLQEKSFERLGSEKTMPVKCRLLAATNRDLNKAIREGTFREDLFYRLNVVPITLPPLRECKRDIPLLATRFARRFACRHGKDRITFSSQALDALARWDWPGNVRQLENLVERLVILNGSGTVIEVHAVLQELDEARSHADCRHDESREADEQSTHFASSRRMDHIERRAILKALEDAGGKVRIAAENLGLSLATIYRKIKSYNIDTRLTSHNGRGKKPRPTAWNEFEPTQSSC